MTHETNNETLIANLARLRTEQAKLREALATSKTRLDAVNADRLAAQRRYDTGYDTAKAMVDELTTERDELESSIARIERDLAEYPDRINHLQREMEIVKYRDGLRELLELRKEEIAAFNAYEQMVMVFVESYEDFFDVQARRKSKANALENLRNMYGLPQFERGDFNAPRWSDIEAWLKAPHASTTTGEYAFQKAREQIVPVD